MDLRLILVFVFIVFNVSNTVRANDLINSYNQEPEEYTALEIILKTAHALYVQSEQKSESPQSKSVWSAQILKQDLRNNYEKNRSIYSRSHQYLPQQQRLFLHGSEHSPLDSAAFRFATSQ